MSKSKLSLEEIPFPDTGTIERQVISDCVGNPESLPELTSIVDESMFTDETRMYIWKTIVWMFNTGQVIDLPTIASRAGRYFIEEILQKGYSPSTPYTALQHALHLRSASMRRRAYYSALKLIQSVTKPDAEELDVLELVQNLTMDVQGENPIVAEANMKSVLTAIDAEIKENKQNTDDGKKTRIPTGFHKLNFLTYGGWGAGQLIVLAARPSVGKTAIMLQMAKAAAIAGFPATIFSLEMTKEELGKRLLFSTGRVQPKEVATGYINYDEYLPAIEELKGLKLYINDESRTLSGILSRIIASVTQGRCRIAFIDYLGLMTIDETNRMQIRDQLAKATRELKSIAKRQKIPIVLLAQLNRDSVKEGREPQLYDLKDSGAIEQDADIVLMLDHEKSIDNTGTPNINIWVRKNRQFKRDIKITVSPNDSYSAFSEVSHDVYEEQDTIDNHNEAPEQPWYNKEQDNEINF